MRDAEAELAAELDKFTAYLENRLDSSRRTFLQRATASLVKHLEENGESKVWTYDPTGLRVLLRSGYQVFSAKATRATGRSTRRPRPRLKGLSWAPSSFPAGPSGWNRPGARHAAAGDAGPDHRARHQGQLVDPLVAPPPQLRRLRRGILGHDRRRDRADDRGAQTDHADVFRDMALKELRRFVAGQRTTLMAMAGQAEERLDELRARMAQDAEPRRPH
jgi:hypothetical protein